MNNCGQEARVKTSGGRSHTGHPKESKLKKVINSSNSRVGQLKIEPISCSLKKTKTWIDMGWSMRFDVSYRIQRLTRRRQFNTSRRNRGSK